MPVLLSIQIGGVAIRAHVYDSYEMPMMEKENERQMRVKLIIKMNEKRTLRRLVMQ